MHLTSIDLWGFRHCNFLKSLRYLLPKFSESGSPEMNTAGIEISIGISCGAKSSRCTWSQKNLEPLVFLWKYLKVLHFGGGIPYYPTFRCQSPAPSLSGKFPGTSRRLFPTGTLACKRRGSAYRPITSTAAFPIANCNGRKVELPL